MKIEKKESFIHQYFRDILLPFVLIFSALALAAIAILAVGKNPLTAYGALLDGAFGSLSAWINTFTKAVPICMCSFAVSMAQKGGSFNIGVEGQFLLGASASALVGIYVTGLPPIIHVSLCLLAGMAAGMLYSLIPTALHIKKGASLLVIFLLMNSISVFLVQYIVLDKFASKNSLVPATEGIQESAKLPYLIQQPNKLSFAVIIVLVCAFALYYFYNKTTAGFELQASGLNRRASYVSGIPTTKYLFLSLVLGGAIAGLGGGLEILGNHHRLYTNFSPGYGYDGIPIALLSGGNPFIAIAGSILFGALRAGSINMKAVSGVSDEIVSVIQGLLIVFVASQYFFKYFLKKISPSKKKVLK